MKNVVLIIQLITAVSLICLVLLQSGKGGLGSSFGGGEQYRTKRGAEQVVFSATIVFCVIFLLTSIINVIIP